MNIYSAIKIFSETYDREAMESIDNISKEYGLNIHGHTIKGFNIKESFDIFNDYLSGYAKYKIENVNNSEAVPHETIKESVSTFIETKITKECEIKYSDLPLIIQEYVNGINRTIENIDSLKTEMVDADVEAEYIGNMNDFCEAFMDKINASFKPMMENVLWASGYNGKNRLFNNENKEKIKAPVFL